MARVRCITEMGMGVDLHGRDATKAAKRAVSDAIRHSSLGFTRFVGKTPHDMIVDVKIGVPDPSGVDTAAVLRQGHRHGGKGRSRKSGRERRRRDHHRQCRGDGQSRRREVSAPRVYH